MSGIGYVSEYATQIARNTIDAIMAGQVRTLGEIDEYVDRQLGDVTDDLKALASGQASPLMQSAIESMKPAIYQALQDYTPTFAAVSGGMLALAVLLGVWVAQRTYEGWR
jgi:hypothetical protein